MTTLFHPHTDEEMLNGISQDPSRLNIALVGRVPGVIMLVVPRDLIARRGEPTLSKNYSMIRSLHDYHGDLDDFCVALVDQILHHWLNGDDPDTEVHTSLYAAISHLLSRDDEWKTSTGALIMINGDRLSLGYYSEMASFRQHLDELLVLAGQCAGNSDPDDDAPPTIH